MLWSLLLLVLPLRLILAAVAAACVHELCHALAIRLLGGRVLALTIGAGGMVMETDAMKPGHELICALAGPVGSLMLVLLFDYWPLLAACAFIQGCFNLLPIYPLDGGRAVSCGLQMAFPADWERIRFWIEVTVLLLLLGAIRLGWWAAAAWGMLAMRKIPCKAGRFGVQ